MKFTRKLKRNKKPNKKSRYSKQICRYSKQIRRYTKHNKNNKNKNKNKEKSKKIRSKRNRLKYGGYLDEESLKDKISRLKNELKRKNKTKNAVNSLFKLYKEIIHLKEDKSRLEEEKNKLVDIVVMNPDNSGWHAYHEETLRREELKEEEEKLKKEEEELLRKYDTASRKVWFALRDHTDNYDYYKNVNLSNLEIWIIPEQGEQIVNDAMKELVDSKNEEKKLDKIIEQLEREGKLLPGK